jgi:hypothetical protein
MRKKRNPLHNVIIPFEVIIIVNDLLKQNGIKIYDVVEVNPDFVEYPYSQKINGGYKEGTMRFWRAAIKYKLKKRMSKHYYTGG